jgi:[Skp1-protein]-hydroxyproline N-acetylglucosaminyltransferase
MLSFKWIVLLAILAFVGFVAWRVYKIYESKRKQKEVLRHCSALGPTENIFVSVPSYRDSETPNTIFDLFCQAQCPYRVFVGVCDQKTSRDVDLYKSLLELARGKAELFFSENPEQFFRQNVRIYPMPARRARGPMVARATIERMLYRNEKYFLCVDSHMKFADHWDATCIEELQKCPSARPILTGLPPPFERRDRWKKKNDESLQGFTCVGDMSPAAFPVLEGLSFAMHPAFSTSQLFWTPCFSFTYAAAHVEVPYDRHCKNVFHGEDISMSARLWTAGWDFFCPVRLVCAHLYDRSYRRTFWELHNSPVRGEKRLQVLLGIRPSNTVHESVLKELDQYGLGSARRLEDYERFCDIEFSKQRVNDRALLGLTPNAPNHEILSKYGSYTDMDRRLAEVKKRK